MQRALIVLTVLLLAVVALPTPAAQAAPGGLGVAAQSDLAFRGRVYVGGGIQIPIGRAHHVHDAGYVEYGHWETRYREVEVVHPGRLLGYDVYGRAIMSAPRREIVQEPYQVWVVDRRVRRVVHHHSPVGYVSLGGAWRIR
jgi:hypothetical protein